MIGICQGQTELSSSLLDGGFVSSRFLTGRALYGLSGAYFVFATVRFFGPEFFVSRLDQRPSVTSHSFARIQPSEAFTED
jgi:hypothetical protein